MIIKSCRRKEPSFGQLLRYIAAEGKSARMPLLHNFPAAVQPGDLDAVIAAFAANARHLPARRNGNALYQEIISFHPGDASALTPAILADLARRYLEQRAPGVPAYADVHHDTAHSHIHLVIAANLSGRSKKLRLSRREFAAVKRELEAYQKERYPQLARSLAQPPLQWERYGRAPPDDAPAIPPVPLPSVTVREDARARRLARQDRGDPARKDRLRKEILQALGRARSAADFQAILRAAGSEIYERDRRLTGVISSGRKYRFTRLGVSDALAAAEAAWQRLPARLSALRNDRLERTRSYFRQFGYAEELLETILPAPATDQERLLRKDRCRRRQRQRETRFRELQRGREPPARLR